MFDPKCAELSQHFLPEADDAKRNELAQAIQDAVELWFDAEEWQARCNLGITRPQDRQCISWWHQSDSSAAQCPQCGQGWRLS